VQICEKYRDYFVVSDPLTCELEPDVMLQKYYLLAPHQKLLVKRYFHHLLSNLGSRQYNSVVVFSDIIDAEGIFTKILLRDFQFVKSHNLIHNSLAKLNQLTLKIYDFIEELQSLSFDQLGKEKLIWLLEHFIPNKPDDFNDNLESVFDEVGKLRVFAFISYVLDKCQVFHQTERTLFNIFYTGGNSVNLPINSIIKKTKQSKGNILLIKRRLKPKIQNLFSFLNDIPPDDFVEYNLSNICLVLNDSFAKKINNREGTNFNFKLYSIIIELLLKNTHSIIGDKKFFEDNLKHAYKRKKPNHFIINSIYCKCFDFEEFIRDIYRRINERPRKVYSLEFQDYLLNFLSDDGKPYMKSIVQICKSILAAEFGFAVTKTGLVEFVSNAKKLLHHYYYEILDEKGSPMKADEISVAVKYKYPLLKFSESDVGKMIKLEPQLFIFIGRTGTYGLRKWENEQEGIKGGSIRDIVEQYLHLELKPKHISDILSHVNKY